MLEQAHSNDLAKIQALLKSCHLPYADLTPQHLEHFLAYKEDRSIVGVVGLEVNGESVLLRSLAVHPDYRGQGIGNRLVEKIEAYAVEMGVKALYLLTTTAAEYFAGRDYQKIERGEAPQEIQATQEFASICPDSAVCMCKEIQ